VCRYKFTPAGQPVITPAIKEAKKAAFRYTRADAPDLQFVQGGEEDVQPRIKAASLERLVERLTYDKYPCTCNAPSAARARTHAHSPHPRVVIDPTLSRTFLLMYRHYTTGQKLMTLLIERFMMTPPPGNVLAQEEWKQRVQTPIRLRYADLPIALLRQGQCSVRRSLLIVEWSLSLARVYNLLKLWIAKHFEDFEQDPALTDMLFRFIVRDFNRSHACAVGLRTRADPQSCAYSSSCRRGRSSRTT
jgi:hypothetical protein